MSKQVFVTSAEGNEDKSLYNEVCKKVESINNTNLVKRIPVYYLDADGDLHCRNSNFKLYCNHFHMVLFDIISQAFVSFEENKLYEDISEFIQKTLCKKYNICGNQINIQSFKEIFIIEAYPQITTDESKVDFKKYLSFVKTMLESKNYNVLLNLIKKESKRYFGMLIESICKYYDFSGCYYINITKPIFVLGYFDVLVDSKPFKVYAVLEITGGEEYDSEYEIEDVDCRILSVNKMPDKNEVFNLILKWVKSLNNLSISLNITDCFDFPRDIYAIPTVPELSKYFSKKRLEQFIEYLEETGIFEKQSWRKWEIIFFFTYLKIGIQAIL